MAQDDDLLNLLLSPITMPYNLWKMVWKKPPLFKKMFERTNMPYVELSVQLFDCVENVELLKNELKKWLAEIAKIDGSSVEILVVSELSVEDLREENEE